MTRYLMCRPTYFAVDYVINPWMDTSVPVDADLAVAQWTALRDTYRALGHTVDEIDAIPGLPDMVFAANGATVVDGIAYGAQFRYPQRAPEAPAYLNWLAGAGLRTHEAKERNEGEGDLLVTGRFLLAGTGFRTDLAAHAEAQELFGRPVITLQLVDPRYYHLDTALTVLGPRHHRVPAGRLLRVQSARARAALPGRHPGHAGGRLGARPQRCQRRPACRAPGPGNRAGPPASPAGLPTRTGGPV